MSALRSKIIVAESCPETRVKICTWLSQAGYSVFECKDAYKVLRLARQLLPNLVLLDVNIGHVSTKHLIPILEKESRSSVLLLSEANNTTIQNLLSITSLNSLIQKPIDQSQLIHSVKDALSKIEVIKKLKPQEERQRLDREKAQVILSAKAILMSKWHLTEDQAFTYIRKTSMDNCISLYATSKAIVERQGK